MKTHKTKLDVAVRRTAEIIENHLANLTPGQAKALLKDIHKLAVKVYRSEGSGKLSRSSRSAARTTEQHEVWTLADSDHEAFVKALQDPPEPSARMRSATRRYRRLLSTS